ncbi:MAG: FAD-dependent oxidoreductase [Candidatus Paceibacterota bacterium]|jgi:ferredoxin-NADP reductase
MYYKYKVLENRLDTESVRILTLAAHDETRRPLLYQPGQYAALILNDQARPTSARCFSITSLPGQQRILQFSMRVSGVFTRALERLEKGDEVLVRGPFGSFVFNENLHQDLVMFAGGIGLAPFMSMIRYASHLKLKNKLTLVYSCRTEDDISFLKELQGLEMSNPSLKVVYVISDGPVDRARAQGLKVISGRVDRSNIGKLGLSYQEQIYMICGPKGYMSAMHSLLKGSGAPKENILTEAFSQGSRLQSEKSTSWPFNMYALTGMSLLISGIFVMASDLAKTAPQANIESSNSQTNSNPDLSSLSLLEKINALGPQVDTNISQPPIIKYKPSTVTTVSNTPVIKPTPAPTPTPVVVQPAPKPTVIPKTKPRTRVS